jgi:opacity protein-like surface antigen
MKNLLLITTITILLSSNAFANINPYVGAGYQFNNVDYNHEDVEIANGTISVNLDDYFEDTLNNYNIFVGVTLESYDISLELGYFKSNKGSKDNNDTGLIWSDTLKPFTTSSTSQLEIISLDTIYAHKIENYDIKVLTLVGLSKISFDRDIDYLDNGVIRASFSETQKGYGFNIGLGFEIIFTDNVSIRALTKRTIVKSIDDFDSLTSYSMGVKYKF